MRDSLLYEMYVLAERPQTPAVLKRCVADVAPKYGGDTSRAFSICVASLQKSGRLEPGTVEPTTLGKKVSKAKAAQKDYGAKLSKYEKLLKKARKK